MSLILQLSLVAPLLFAHGWNVADTPVMGWNSWNYWACRVNATVLTSTAKAMVDTGLAAVGYEFVNSDDCWMMANRSASGEQVPDPAKFPGGWLPVTSYIHSLGLKAGLYTAKGPHTCQGLAASCNHEVQDAAEWASWGIDYVKDDACSTCPGYSDDQIYGIMWQAIQASGRPMVLTVEGNPDDSLISRGGYGNAKRVGHDIMARWMSMVSLVDIGSGLWMYAHNSTNSTVGGWWNDLDMIEIGNGPDFDCAADADSLVRCQAHFTQWTIMKAPLILGNNVPAIVPETLSVLTNKEAIAVNQDPWGIQARRVSVSLPSNNSLGMDMKDNIGVLAPCDGSRTTQRWRFNNASMPQGGILTTQDDAGNTWCLVSRCETEGCWGGNLCPGGSCFNGGNQTTCNIYYVKGPSASQGPANYSIHGVGPSPGWNAQPGASGPWPHTRYLNPYPYGPQWTLDLAAASSGTGTTIMAADHVSILDDDLVGHVTSGGDFCLDLVTGGMLEVWAGLLSPAPGSAHPRIAVSLFNRGQVPDTITAQWGDIGASGSYSVRDIWAAADRGTFSASYSALVPAHGTVYLVLTPL